MDDLLRTTKELVEEALRDDVNCRNDDLWLILSVWRKQGLNVTMDYEKLPDVSNFESIRRFRQKIQNTEGRYPPTSINVLRKRRDFQEIMKEEIRKP